jgi:hypothetical protein
VNILLLSLLLKTISSLSAKTLTITSLFLLLAFTAVYTVFEINVIVESSGMYCRVVNVYLTTWQYIPEDSKLHTRRREKLKSHKRHCVADTENGVKEFNVSNMKYARS